MLPLNTGPLHTGLTVILITGFSSWCIDIVQEKIDDGHSWGNNAMIGCYSLRLNKCTDTDQ